MSGESLHILPQVFKCGAIWQCPGGRPKSCAGGRDGVPCAECPQGEGPCRGFIIFLRVSMSPVLVRGFATKNPVIKLPCAAFLMSQSQAQFGPHAPGKTWTSGSCNDCEGWRTALWVGGLVVQAHKQETASFDASIRSHTLFFV